MEVSSGLSKKRSGVRKTKYLKLLIVEVHIFATSWGRTIELRQFDCGYETLNFFTPKPSG
jgi:hypothetical protein